MLEKGGNVRIIDFGIAKSDSDKSLTIAGTACGTVGYMAPEQFAPTPDTKFTLVDIYATCTTLFHIVTGRLPFEGDNEFVLRDAKCFKDPPKPSDLNPEVSPALERIILKALDPDPDRRYQSAGEMIGALSELTGPGPTPPPGTPVPKLPNAPVSKWIKTIIATGIALIAALAIIWSVSEFSSDQPAVVPEEPPRLVSPADGYTQTGSKPLQFVWRSVSGSDISYNWQMADDKDFMNPRTKIGLKDTTHTIDTSLAAGTYYWRVQALQDYSSPLQSEDRFSFTISSEHIPKGTMELRSNVNARFFLNGKMVTSRVKEFDTVLPPAQYLISVTAGNTVQGSIDSTVSIQDSQVESRYFKFDRPQQRPDRPEHPKKRYSVLILALEASLAKISIQGEGFSDTLQQTPYRFNLLEGNYRVTVVDNGESLSKNIAVSSDTAFTFDFEADTVLDGRPDL